MVEKLDEIGGKCAAKSVENKQECSQKVENVENLPKTPADGAILKLSQAETLEHLLAARSDVNAPDSSGRTLLHDAALSGSAGAMHVLLSRGAHVDTCDRSGQTALNMVARHGHSDCVSLLLNVS